MLGIEQQGQARVHVRYLGPAPRHVNADGSSVATPSPQPAVNTLAGGPAEEEGPIQLTPPPRTHGRSSSEQPAPQPMQASAPPVVGGYFVQVGAFSICPTPTVSAPRFWRAGPVVVDTTRRQR